MVSEIVSLGNAILTLAVEVILANAARHSLETKPVPGLNLGCAVQWQVAAALATVIVVKAVVYLENVSRRFLTGTTV